MTAHSLLWIDMTVSVQDVESVTGFDKAFNVHRSSALSSIDAEIERVNPAVICFDFDFPTKHGLKLLQHIKETHSSLPLIMLTVQHSEDLAVWAFRSRVWDYLVKPIPRDDVNRCVRCLTEMLSVCDKHAARRKAAMPISVIPEENRADGPKGQDPLALLPAIGYVEQNYRDRISSSHAAELCGMTSFRFSRVFKESYGLTFQEYLLRFRVREACRLLKNPNAQVTDVAYLSGFNDPSYFARIFKRFTRTSPSRFAEGSEARLDPEHLLEGLSAQ
jgi:YesN/AraC family two-component response regulator